MRVFYCKKCKIDSTSPICDHCGMQIPPQSGKFKWQIMRVPILDMQTVFGALKILTLIAVVLTLLLFLGELIVSPDKQVALQLVSANGIVSWLLILLVAMAACVLLVLGLQGKEELHYEVNNRGAHLQVWMEPGYIKCLSRAIVYNQFNIVTDPEGNQHMKVSETHLLWEDVRRYEVRKRACRIDLYRPSGYRFLSLHAEAEDLEALVQYMTPRMKQLVRK